MMKSVVAAVLLVVSCAFAQSSLSFRAARTFDLGLTPAAVVTADLNRDGKLDLVAATSGNDIAVSLGNGDGTFQPATFYSVGLYPQSVALGDFDGDGNLDIVVACSAFSSNHLTVLLGKGDGTFTPQNPFAADSQPYSVAVGDFDQDGKLDLAVVNNGSNDVSVMLGNGDGTFQAPVNYTVGYQPRAVAIGDFNKDGYLDLAVVNQGAGSVSILLGAGNGSFAEVSGSPFNTGSYPNAITISDFNGDGTLDLAITAGNTVGVMIGDGDGTFQSVVTYAVDNSPYAVAAGDFNGDGKPDLVTGNNGRGDVSILINNGDGTFQPAVNYASGDSPTSLAVADFDRDGHLDVVAAIRYGVSFIQGNGDGTFQAAPEYAAGDYPQGVVAADFDLDGKMDLAVVNSYSNTVDILRGNGDGTFQPAIRYTAGNGWGARAIAAGDFNGDGYPDIAVVDGSSFTATAGTLNVLINKGDGTFLPMVQYPAGINPNAIVAADFNGDGKVDLAESNLGYPGMWNSFSVLVMLGNGDGTFQPAIIRAADVGAPALATGDLNLDGKFDLAISYANSTTGEWDTFFGNGNGTFQTEKYQPLNTFYLNPYAMAVGDLNGDGYPDVVVAAGNGSANPDHTVVVVINNGMGYRGTPAVYDGGITATSVAIADFNGDGKPDLVTSNQSDGVAAVLLGNGDGTFQPPVKFAAGGSLRWVVAADFNGDGKPDIAVSSPGGNALGGNISVLLNTTRPGSSITLTSSANPSTQGQTVTFTATVSSSQGTPSGDVTFFDGATMLGTQPLNGGVAAFPTSTLSVGSHSITAVYGGDTTFAGSSSSALSQAVQGLPAFSVSSSSVTFGSQLMGTTSAAQALKVSNPGSSPLIITSIVATGDFAVNNNCGTSLGAGLGCGITVTFTPTATGARTGAITITDNAADSPQTVSLSGNGTSPAPVANLSSNSANFAGQDVGSTSASQSVTLSNTGGGPLTITSIVASGDFAVTSDCGGSLAAGSNCSITVTFTPTASGTRTGAITITDNSANSPQTVTLTGTGTTPAPATTTTSMAATNPVTTYGGAALFTASVTSASCTPTGSVAFVDAANPLGTGSIGANGQATFSIATLAVGSHSITAVYSGNTSCATSTSSALVQTVAKATLTVTADNKTMNAGVTVPAFTYTVTGFVNGDTSAAISGTPQLTSTATSSSAAGTYPITIAAGTLAAANYGFNFVNGALTVNAVAPPPVSTPAILSVTPSVTNAGSPDLQITINGTGFVSGAKMHCNGWDYPATFVSSTQLTSTVPAVNFQSSGVFPMTVINPDSGTSAGFIFVVDSPSGGRMGDVRATGQMNSLSMSRGQSASLPINFTATTTPLQISANCVNLAPGMSCGLASDNKSVAFTTASTTPPGTYQVMVVFTINWRGRLKMASLFGLPILMLWLGVLKRRGVRPRVLMAIVLLALAVAVGCGYTPPPDALTTSTEQSSVPVTITVNP